MNKKDLIKTMAERLEYSQTEVNTMVDILFDELKQAMLDGKTVEIRDFGVFSPRIRKPKIGRIVKKNIPVQVPEQKIIFFRAGKNLIKNLNSNG